MKRIIFLNRVYWPEEPATALLLGELAPALAAHGIAVTVIASRPPAGAGAHARTHEGVRVEHVGSLRSGRRSIPGRLLELLSFHVLASLRLLRLTRPGDIIVALTDPPMIGVAAWAVASLRRAHLVHWVQDVYPEVAAAVTGRRVLLALRPLRNLSWRGASACVFPSAEMAAVAVQAGLAAPWITTLPNWAPASARPAAAAAIAEVRRDWGLEGKFVAAYSGNLGRVHDLDPLLEVAALLQREADFVLLLVGDGAQRQRLQTAAAARGLTNVQFRPVQPTARLAATLGAAEVHLVTVRPGCESYVFPSKLYGVAAVGRPVIAIAPAGCELARIPVAAGFGFSFTRSDTAGVAAALLQLAGNAALRTRLGAAARQFAQDGAIRAVERWSGLLSALPRAAPGGTPELPP